MPVLTSVYSLFSSGIVNERNPFWKYLLLRDGRDMQRSQGDIRGLSGAAIQSSVTL